MLFRSQKAFYLGLVQKLQPAPDCPKRTAMYQEALTPLPVGPKASVGCDAKLKEDVAKTLGIDVVNRFRHADVAAGGEGAPFAPLYHRALAAKLPRPVMVLNLGGVGNVTYIDGETVIAFDTGPASALIDDFMLRRRGLPYDEDGKLAARGTIDAGVLADVMAGQISLSFSNMPAYTPQIKAGRIRALAVSTSRRSPAAPEIPTMAEAGVPGYVAVAWFGLLAPANTPRDIVNKLSAETARILKMPDVNSRLTDLGAEPVGSTPAEFDAHIKSEIVKWAKVIKDANVELQ